MFPTADDPRLRPWHPDMPGHAVLDPALIVLGGGLAGHPDLLPPLRKALAALGPHVPALATSTLGTDAVLRGAEAVAAGRVREELFRRITGPDTPAIVRDLVDRGWPGNGCGHRCPP